MRSKAWATSNRQEANDEFSDRRCECGRGGGFERGLDRGADEGGGAAEEEVGGGAGEVQRRGAARGGAEAGDAAQPAAEAAARAQGPPGQGECGSWARSQGFGFRQFVANSGRKHRSQTQVAIM